MKTLVFGSEGVLGQALASVFKSKGLKVFDYDIKAHKSEYLIDCIKKTDIVFLCLPTPTNSAGTQDISSIHASLSILSSNHFKGPVVIKSTVLPGTCQRLQDAFGLLGLVHNPEFLTEKNSVEDFANQKTVLVSGNKKDALGDVIRFYESAFQYVDVISSFKFETTELAKYFHNTFLATKVGFANEFALLCKNYFVEFDDVRQMALSQGKIGANHTQVPGPDGKLGFGGSCFPKDNGALIKKHPELSILKSVIDSNKKIRGNN